MNQQDTAADVVPALPVQPAPGYPSISSFWRRLAAWAVDVVLLALIGQVIGRSLAPSWVEIGPYGRFVGLLIVLPYFGLMNSRTAGGQTLGKRLLGIAVRGADNQPLALGRSLARASILILPLLFNGWAIPVLQLPVLGWLAGVVTFGLGSAILYTMVFNRRARQGLHDLLCRTYVVHLSGDPTPNFPDSARVHWTASAVLVGLAAILSGLLSFFPQIVLSGLQVSPSVFGIYRALHDDGRFFSARVTASTTYDTQGSTVRALNIDVWYKGSLSYEHGVGLINELGQLALNLAEDIGQYDMLLVQVTSKYDLGIATGRFTIGDNEPIEVWRARSVSP
jgi:uncharacterized RDD family membrane protein YckC